MSTRGLPPLPESALVELGSFMNGSASPPAPTLARVEGFTPVTASTTDVGASASGLAGGPDAATTMKTTSTATTTALTPLPHAHGLCHQGRAVTALRARERVGAASGRGAEPLRGVEPLVGGEPVRPLEPLPPVESSCRRCLESRATITPRSARARATRCGARPSRPFEPILSRVGAHRPGSNVGKPPGRRTGARCWLRWPRHEWPRCNGNVTSRHGRCHSLPTAALARAGSAHHLAVAP